MNAYRQPAQVPEAEHEKGMRLVGPGASRSQLRLDGTALLVCALWVAGMLAMFSVDVPAGSESMFRLTVLMGLWSAAAYAGVVWAGNGFADRSLLRTRSREEIAWGDGVLWIGRVGTRAEARGTHWWFRCVGAYSEFRCVLHLTVPTHFTGSARLILPARGVERGARGRPMWERFREGPPGRRQLLAHEGQLHLVWVDYECAPSLSALHSWLQAVAVELESAFAPGLPCFKVRKVIRQAQAAMRLDDVTRFSLARCSELEEELRQLRCVDLPELRLVPTCS